MRQKTTGNKWESALLQTWWLCLVPWGKAHSSKGLLSPSISPRYSPGWVSTYCYPKSPCLGALQTLPEAWWVGYSTMVGACDVSVQRANMSIRVPMCSPVMWLLSLEGCVPVQLLPLQPV